MSTIRPTRRNLLIGTAGIATTAATAPGWCKVDTSVESPDAELIAMDREAIRLLAEYQRHLNAFFALPDDSPDLEAVAATGDVPFDRLEEMTDRAIVLRASTIEGFIAKARLLRFHIAQENSEQGVIGNFEGCGRDAPLAWSLVNDMLAGSAVA